MNDVFLFVLEGHRIDFSSQGINQCPQLLAPEEVVDEPAEIPATTEKMFKPWKPAAIQGTNIFRAKIGPTGGERGYTTITGNENL